jgi:hypothetical protein
MDLDERRLLDRKPHGHGDTLPGLIERFAAVTVSLRDTGTKLGLDYAEFEEVRTALAEKGVHTDASFVAWVDAGLSAWREGKRAERDVPPRVFEVGDDVEVPLAPLEPWR